jgi:hypothetical protein
MKAAIALLALLLPACVKESDPVAPPEMSVSFVPTVTTSSIDYNRLGIEAKVPDSTLWLACRNAYNGKYSEALKTALADTFVHRAFRLGFPEVETRGCLTGSGQMQYGVVSLLYRAERASYYGVQCWILEFAWGTNGSGITEFRCCLMDAGTFNPRLILTSSAPSERLFSFGDFRTLE